MKKILIYSPLAMCLLCFACKKSKTDPAPISPLMYIPSSDAPYAAKMMATTSPATDLGTPLTDVWGIFLLVRLESGMSDTSDVAAYHYEDWQEAFFCGADGTGYTAPAALSVNNTTISQTGNIFLLGGQWRSGSLNHWEASRNKNIPEISANMMDTYPSFGGPFPQEQVSLSSGFSYTFDPAKITNADSGYVLLHANGMVAKSNTVSLKYGSANIAKITAAQLANMHNEYFSLDNKTFYGGVREIVIYKDTTITFENKKFAFVDQREIVGKVIFRQ